MIEGKSVLAIITARGGSKGVPRKNILPLAGKPLIAWTIEAAQNSQYIDRCILSSDDNEIIAVAEQFGCEVPFVRPAELARDTTPSMDVVWHAVDTLPTSYDYIVLLQPTSPLRTAEDIDGALRQCIDSHKPSCVSVSEVPKSPFWMYTLDKDNKLQPLLGDQSNAYQRQQLPAVYALNGAVYVAHHKWLRESSAFVTAATIGYIMPALRSVDIDTLSDFRICEFLLSEEG